MCEKEGFLAQRYLLLNSSNIYSLARQMNVKMILRDIVD